MLKYFLPVAFALRPSMVYGMIKSRLSEIIPLNQLLGIEIISIDDGTAKARLPFRVENTNHIGTVHATAIFGLAEAASGAAMSGAFAPVATTIRPVAASAHIEFLKIARTDLVASAKTSRDSKELRDALAKDDKVKFDVSVEVIDTDSVEIARIGVSWHVSNRVKA